MSSTRVKDLSGRIAPRLHDFVATLGPLSSPNERSFGSNSSTNKPYIEPVRSANNLSPKVQTRRSFGPISSIYFGPNNSTQERCFQGFPSPILTMCPPSPISAPLLCNRKPITAEVTKYRKKIKKSPGSSRGVRQLSRGQATSGMSSSSNRPLAPSMPLWPRAPFAPMAPSSLSAEGDRFRLLRRRPSSSTCRPKKKRTHKTQEDKGSIIRLCITGGQMEMAIRLFGAIFELHCEHK